MQLFQVQQIPVAATVDEAAHLLRTSRSRVYELLEANELRSFLLGRKRLVCGESIAALMREREQHAYAATCEVMTMKCQPACAPA